MIDDKISAKTIAEVEQALVTIDAKIEELANTDWTAKIANAVRRDPAKARGIVEMERDSADDLRLCQARKVACTQKLNELREEERTAKLGPVLASHTAAINDCIKSLRAAQKAFTAMVAALDSYDAARAAVAKAVTDEFNLLPFAEDRDPSTEAYLSKPGQSGLGVPISEELTELAQGLGAASARAGFLADRPAIGRVFAASVQITSEVQK